MIPTCVDFWIWVATGAFIVPALEFLKKLPTVGDFVKQWAFILAPLLTALAPVLAQAATAQCDKIDPLLWIALYAGLVYLVNQLVYWLGKKFNIIV